MWGHFEVALSDVLKQLLLVSADQHKGRLSCEHLIDYAADAPPVHSESVSLPIYDLGCKVFGSTAQRQSVSITLDVFLGQSKVGQLRIPVFIYQYILRLQVSIDNLILVQVIDSKDDLCTVELSAILL